MKHDDIFIMHILFHYSHWGKHAQKPELASMNFPTFSAWPWRVHGIPTDLVPQFKEQPT